MFALAPGEIGKIVLQCHAKLENPPYCLVKSLTTQQERELSREYDDSWKFSSPDERYDKVKSMFQKYVFEVHGFATDDPETGLNSACMQEILSRLLAHNLISYEEKKS